jgi:glutathione peroxidase
VEQFGAQGFQVAAFPCDQFFNQEPGALFLISYIVAGTDQEIPYCLKYVRPGGGFVPNFPLFQKAHVNGGDQMAVYGWLKSRCGPPIPYIGDTAYISWTPVMTTDITWNFEKVVNVSLNND